MGDLRELEIITMTNNHPEFYRLIGPFLARREIAKELGSPYEPFWDEDDKLWFVAMQAGMVVGLASLLPKPYGFLFCEAYVVPAFRKQGIHSRLVEARLAHCPQGATVQVLACEISIKQYERRGFTIKRKRGKTWVEMTKQIGEV